MEMRFMFCLTATAAAIQCLAALELMSPIGGASVSLLPDAQRQLMSLPTLAERLSLLNKEQPSGKALHDACSWRRSRALEFKWLATEGETGPWKIEIGKSPDLSDARTWYFSDKKADAATGREEGESKTSAGEVSHKIKRANLEIARTYYWRVTSRGRCGFGCGPRHQCKESRRVVCSEIASFHTEDLAPRWIEVEGRVSNIRDLGGRHTDDGRRVKQGMAYRGQGLNNNSETGEEPGRNRLMVEDLKYLKDTLGIRTDLDLRGIGETAGMKVSPLGSDIKFIQRSTMCYAGIFSDKGKKVMAENFREFCRSENYPIYFHCIGGADRTGSLAYVLNGILGVDRRELETDWESTFYPNIPDSNPDPNYWCRESHFNDGFSKYGAEGDCWRRRIELYLLDCGVTEDEIEAFRLIMLE